MFWSDWESLGRVLAIGPLTYVAVVVVLRVSGKRTLSKLNAFDFVVTVALGSALATATLSSDVPFTTAVTALIVFVGAQLVVTWMSVRVKGVRRLARSTPTALVLDGQLLDAQLRAARITESELRQAVRSEGVGGFDLIAAVVLESDGTLSVIRHDRVGSGNALDALD